MLTISLEQLRFHSPVGVYPEERVLGNDFLIDIHIKIEEGTQAITKLSETIDYVQVYNLIKAEMAKEQQLIETIAQNCVQAIKERWPSIKETEMIIKKMNPLLQGEVGCSKITFTKVF